MAAIDDLIRDMKRAGEIDPLTNEVKSASAALKLFRAELTNTKTTVSSVSSGGSALQSGLTAVAAGGIKAMGQPGAGGVDALTGAIQGLSSALPSIGAAVGFAVGGPLGAAAGGLLGTAGSAAIDRFAGPGMKARDMAISDVTGLTSSRAAAGMQIPPQALASMLEGSMIRSRRIVDNEASVRSASNSLTSLQTMFGSAR